MVQQIIEQTVEEVIAWIARDPPDLLAAIDKHECRASDDGGSQDDTDRGGTQPMPQKGSMAPFCGVGISRTDLGVPLAAPTAACRFEHDQFGAVGGS